MDLTSERRVFLALVAASIAVGICLYQHHFILEPNWASVAKASIHRCARVLFAMLAWLTVELLVLAWKLTARPARTAGIVAG